MSPFDSMRKQQFAVTFLDGVVVDNLDPTQSRRVKVRVGGVHDDIADEQQLPWAACGVYGGRGPHQSAGTVAIPRIGSTVLVVFQQGDPQNPLYLGGVHSSAQVPDLFKTNYPNRSGWLLPNGTYFYVDEVTGNFFVQHQGTTVDITNTGAVSAFVADTLFAEITGATTIKCPTLLVDCPSSTFTGNVLIQKHLTVLEGISGLGNIAFSGGDMVIDGYSVKGHHHIGNLGVPTSPAQP